MRKPIVALGCLLLFGGGWWIGKGQTPQHQAGGSDWKNLSHDYLYLAGFPQGYFRGMVHGGGLAMEHNAPEKMQPMSPAVRAELNLAHEVGPFLMEQKLSANELEPTVSAFYNDYRNMPVCIADAVLFSAASLAGNAATEQELGARESAGRNLTVNDQHASSCGNRYLSRQRLTSRGRARQG
jgi:hypothetical protein